MTSPRTPQGARKFASRFRPQVETLESRWVPTTVTNLNDAGAGALRQAILDTPSGGTVDFQPGLSGTITLTTGELAIAKDLTVAGPGAGVITVSGNNASRVFNIAATFTVTLSGLTISGGRVTGSTSQGGGIYNAGTLTVTDSTISGNSVSGVSGADGGGIANAGTLTVAGATLNNNSAYSDSGIFGSAGSSGGGISSGGNLTVTGSILSGNSVSAVARCFGSGCVVFASSYGGGISGAGTVIGSTLSNNSVSALALGGAARAYALGGGIRNSTYGTLTVTGSTISGNTNRGIDNDLGTLTVTGSTITGNSGGGISNSGTVTITASTLSGNSGRGIINFGRTLTVTGSTISGNSGSGIYQDFGTLTVTSSTISGNSSSSGGGIYHSGGTVIARNTLVAGNTAPTAPDVLGSLTSQGHNLIGDGTGGTGFHATDLVGTAEAPIDPLLGSLDDNGGPTLTYALLPDSPAINAGDNADPPDADQRGAPRIIGGTLDIGAFEVQPTRVWIGGAYQDVCAGTQSGDPTAWSNPLNWLESGVPGVWDTVAFVDRVLVAQCSGTDIYGPFTTNSVVDAAAAGAVNSLDSAWAGTINLTRPDLTLTGVSQWSGGTVAGGTLTNDGSLTVSGGTLTGNFRNTGLILLGGTGSDQSFLVNGDYIQSGALLIGPDSTFRVTGTYRQEAGGVTYLVYGILAAPTIDLAADSMLAGSGTLTGNVRNAGYVFVGDYGAAGYLIVNGDYTQTSTGWLFLELGSLAAEDYDVMVVTGTASLEGVLYVGLLPSFTVADGAGYAVLWFGARGAGEPAVYLPDLGPDYYWEAVFDSNYLALWLWPAA